MAEVISRETFESLSPRDRGFAVYMYGCRDDQPNIPDESNPFQKGCGDWEEWNQGQHEAVIAVQDNP